MTNESPDRTHLRRDDVPDALAIIEAVAEQRTIRGDHVPGYEPSHGGAIVSWSTLIDSAGFSSTEVACLQLAQAIATLERHGGAAPRMRRALTTAFSRQLQLVGVTAGVLDFLEAEAGPS